MKVKLVRSSIGKPPMIRKTLVALGLGKMHRVVILPDNPSVKGMVAKVRHLVEIIKD